jgi:monoamine oxidase
MAPGRALVEGDVEEHTAALNLDVAVIGGGIAGTYCAWRLTGAGGATEHDARSVGLFEYSDRIGGRLYTRFLPGMPNVPAELGGMRYIPSSQPMVSHLVDHLRLPTRDFPMGSDAPGHDGKPIGDAQNYLYLRGEHLLQEDTRDPSKVPYNLTWSEEGKNAQDLQLSVMKLLAPGMDTMSLQDQMRIEVFGQPMYTYGYWNLLARVLSSEAFQYMKDAGGYEANVANASAVAQLPATEYGGPTQYLALVRGYQQLPETLAEQFARQPRSTLQRNRRLSSITRDPDGRHRLTFHVTETVEEGKPLGGRHWVTRDVPGAPPVVVLAKDVILAMPRRSLELVDWDGWSKDEAKALRSTVLIQHAFKLFLGYTYPWWQALGLVAGRSITDLPVRQIYYFGTEGAQPGTDDDKNTNSLMMASYNDMGTVPFWKGLETGAPYLGSTPLRGFVTGTAPVPVSECVATANIVEAAHRQIMQIHGQTEINLPYSAIYHDWSEDPYGGGWHEWKPGFRFDEVIPKIRQPVAGDSVYICGEAYSNNQGWVEGALQTAEHVLRDKLHLTWPTWLKNLDPDATLGP